MPTKRVHGACDVRAVAAASISVCVPMPWQRQEGPWELVAPCRGGAVGVLCVWMRGGVGGRELQVGGGGKALLGSGKVEKKSKKKKSKKKKEKKKKRQKDRNSPY